MKATVLTIILLINFNVTMAQEKKHAHLMVADSTWGVEFFKLPTGFATNMTYSGFEEAFFPKGWGLVESPEFWSYLFTWSVEAELPLTTDDFETNLERYFDGLLNIADKDSTVTKLPSTVLVIQTKNVQNASTFVGKLRIFDRFRTNKMIILHLLIEQHFCEKEKRAVIVFRFSPKPLGNDIWDTLHSVVLQKDFCAH